jgi:hypothetical protein
MNYWKTSMCLYKEGKLIETEHTDIQRGIFQGDSFSLLLLFISLISLHTAIEQVEHRI